MLCHLTLTRTFVPTVGTTAAVSTRPVEPSRVKMIDPAELQAFLDRIEGGEVAVDLLKIGQSHFQQNAPCGKNSKYNGNFRLALDMEDCLDRFYGGYYSDWACGGQWNRAYQFVQLLANAFKNAHVEVIAFFDGTLKKNKKLTTERNDFRQKTISVLKHIRMIGTPPPKIWWLPPTGIRTALRNALRSVDIQVAQTVTDHTMEIIEYFQEQKLDGILGLHPDFIIANTPRYFSSHDLRLSYKGALETKEFMVSKLLSSLSLTADHLPFVAVFLGGFILIDEAKIKAIHKKLKIDGNLDFDARIRKIAQIVRNSPTTDIDEFIKHLSLQKYEIEIKESVEYYQRKGKYSLKNKALGKKGRAEALKNVIVEQPAPFASETNENDEMARKILNDVNNLVDEEATADSKANEKAESKDKEEPSKKPQPLIYVFPAEVLKTALNRHQRGMMDSRIYQLLTKKEIILPQILEDPQYRAIPSVHLFYRPARQMIYAILFNLYHQKYLCSQRNSASGNDKSSDKKENKKEHGIKVPVIQVAEWIWSPQNQYKEPELVSAQLLPWAVPTIQRLWFGMAFEDKQRRMKAFLTVMRSDSPLMLNRGYVPQHMLVMACVLRYIVTDPERKTILTRQELDAFLATAFSPQLQMVDYTQDLVLPGVHLRGVYLATLFMQGVETASLANDSCGVPLPWAMTNPWLFFDGKLFHLKLKMSTYVTTLRELCDDHIEIVLKIERFRKAILEDVEHFLLPAAHIDALFRPGFLPPPLPVPYNKGAFSLATAAAATGSNGTIFYPQAPYFSLSPTFLGREAITGVNPPVTNNRTGNQNPGQNRPNPNYNNRRGYQQLKVGGIVTGSWATGGGAATRSLFGPPGNRIGNKLSANLSRLGAGTRGKPSVQARLQRNQSQGNIAARSISRAYGNKLNARNRNKQKKKENRKTNKKDKKDTSKEEAKKEKEEEDDDEDEDTSDEKEEATKTAIDTVSEKIKGISLRECTVELQNGTTVLASDLANSMCDEILKDENSDESSTKEKSSEDESSNKVNELENAPVEVQNDTGASGDGTPTPTETEETTESAKQSKGPAKGTAPKKPKGKKNGAANKTATTNNDVDDGEVAEIGQGDVSVKG